MSNLRGLGISLSQTVPHCSRKIIATLNIIFAHWTCDIFLALHWIWPACFNKEKHEKRQKKSPWSSILNYISVVRLLRLLWEPIAIVHVYTGSQCYMYSKEIWKTNTLNKQVGRNAIIYVLFHLLLDKHGNDFLKMSFYQWNMWTKIFL